MSEPVKPKVMLVEENPDVVTLLSGLLSLSGMETVKARSIPECVDKVHEGGIQVALINGKLAQEKGGLLISKIKQADPEIGIIVVADEESDRSRLLRLGCEDFARPPISAQTLIEKVMMLIAKKNRPQELGA